MYIVISLITIVMFLIYLKEMKSTKIDTKTIVFVGLFTAISYVLYMIKFIPYPQGGGITLFSMLPTMLLTIMFGRGAGLTSGILFGVTKLLNGGIILHPLQFMLDYILSNMVLGFSDVFGTDKKYKILLGSLFATLLSTLMCIISGAVFFGEYANGMNVWVYSTIYNASSMGVEGILTSALMTFLPMTTFIKVAKTNNKRKLKQQNN